MNKKTKANRYSHALEHLIEAQRNIYSKDALLFLFGTKPSVDIRHDPRCEKDVMGLVKTSAEMVLQRKLYIKEYRLNGGRGLLLLKKPLRKKINSIKEMGEVLGIPTCCVKQYVKEDNGNGFSKNSAVRYLEQLKSLKLKEDPFEILVGLIGAELGYSFVPCHPKCEKALKIVKDLKKIEKDVLLKK